MINKVRVLQIPRKGYSTRAETCLPPLDKLPSPIAAMPKAKKTPPEIRNAVERWVIPRQNFRRHLTQSDCGYGHCTQASYGSTNEHTIGIVYEIVSFFSLFYGHW